MTATTYFLLFTSLVFSAVVAFYQYLYKADSQLKINWLLAFFRFISVLLLLVLVINPVISTKTNEINKIPLAIVSDNSSSIRELKANDKALELAQKLKTNSVLKEKFEIQHYAFDNEFKAGINLDFKGKQSNIDVAAQNLKQLHKNIFYPVVLLTDGNQTIGNDYVYSFQETAKVYPVVLGDTTTNFDCKINQVNANKYAFLKNKFPVEVFVQYNGNKPLNASFTIEKGNTKVYSQKISFTKTSKVQSFQVLLEADKVGIQKYKASLSASLIEKNKYNNVKNFAIEVIDQRKEIALVADITHPDISALKRAIESNVQRKVTLIKPNEFNNLNKFNLLILYQPNINFKSIIDANKNLKINTFIITGLNTDFNFINLIQSDLEFKMSQQKEDFNANYETTFNLFAQKDIQFSSLPPLQHKFGKIIEKSSLNTLLRSQVNGVAFDNPILTFSEKGANRTAYFLGENIWKWRLESHLSSQSFDNFDQFIDRIIQYLSTNSSKKALIVEHESFYNSGEIIEIFAQYFNKNYELDENANLVIQLINNRTKKTKNYNFSKINQGYVVKFDGLEHGSYAFKVRETNSNAIYSGSFEVLDFDVEKQFVNPDQEKLAQLALQNKGELFYPNQIEQLIIRLTEKGTYLPIEKSVVKTTPLIEWITLLILLIISLASEWFIRKYNGLL